MRFLIVFFALFFLCQPSFSEEIKSASENGTTITFDFLPYSDEEPCSCGSVSIHYGVDFASPQRTDVKMIADGEVVKIENDKNALVYVKDGGACGRYIVFRHDCPNGKSLFVRFAHLENIIDKDGKPLSEGMSFKKGDKIAETNNNSFFHLEIRPADMPSIDNKQAFALSYENDKNMEWTKYGAIDPFSVDLNTCSLKE
ncbi:MAG: M23 family metallopeptidase [Alphaproteobacteria bacterium]